jgi:hypothetical protein
MVPFNAISDKRLFLRDIRVLAAICARADKRGYTIKREQIAEDAGIHVSHVSKSTTRLVEFGWLTRSETAHKGTVKHYRVNFKNNPQRVATPDTLNRGAATAPLYDPKGGHGGYIKGGHGGVPSLITQTIEQTITAQHSDTSTRSAIIAALSTLNFRHENVHTPAMMGTIKRWCENGITVDDVIAVTNTLRTRYPSKEFGPAYIDNPLTEYHQAKENHNGHETRTGHQSAANRNAEFFESCKAYAARSMDSGTVYENPGEVREQMDDVLPEHGDSDGGNGGVAAGTLRIIG